MSESTRRNFLIASGAGAAAVGVAAALPSSASAVAAGKQAAGKPSTSANAEPLVAHVGDPSTGTLSLFVADRELVLHDPDLVARLTSAAARSREA
ncbi:MAG TPA: ubiquinol-cytochrome c reductase iron-sulfur subunit N-terminal domain-containing protein [Jatrophihabitans sp.]|jgi:hypothetical protein|nr:ubiquinol-cytochrome c reductase iron-sulfur subunit N-terminal domain-containing protein [Jatrophihabitans sp.]